MKTEVTYTLLNTLERRGDVISKAPELYYCRSSLNLTKQNIILKISLTKPAHNFHIIYYHFVNAHILKYLKYIYIEKNILQLPGSILTQWSVTFLRTHSIERPFLVIENISISNQTKNLCTVMCVIETISSFVIELTTSFPHTYKHVINFCFLVFAFWICYRIFSDNLIR